MIEVVGQWDLFCNMYAPPFSDFNLQSERSEQEIISKILKHDNLRYLVTRWVRILPVRDLSNKEESDELSDTDSFAKNVRSLLRKYENEDNTNPTPGGALKTDDYLEKQNPNNITKICNSSLNGRYVVAQETIKKDEIIIRDRAFSSVPVHNQSVLSGLQLPSTCAHCIRINVLPTKVSQSANQNMCPKCLAVIYCSDMCERNDYRQLHEYECKGYRMDMWYYLGVSHLAFRTMLTGVFESIEFLNLKQVKSNLWFDTISAAVTVDCENDSGSNDNGDDTASSSKQQIFRYGEVFKLLSNFKNVTDRDFLFYSITAAMLTIYLKVHTDFFNEPCFSTIKSPRNTEILIGSLILRHMGQMITNSHSIFGIVPNQTLIPITSSLLNTNNPLLNNKITCPAGKLHSYAHVSIVATAIFPHISILNHSCDPNIRNHFQQNYLTIYATRDIRTNDEIYNCYCPTYRLRTKEARLYSLKKQYGFICTCDKCYSATLEPDVFTNDEYQVTHQLYQCEKCINKIHLPTKSLFWWRGNRQLPFDVEINCSKCFALVNFNWYQEFLDIFNGNAQNYLDDACKIYHKVRNILIGSHDQKMDMAEKLLLSIAELLRYDITFEKDLIVSLLTVADDYLISREERYGKMSLEYISASAYVLDMVVLLKQLNDINDEPVNITRQPTNYTELLHIYDKMLPKEVFAMFQNYIFNYLF